jgi:uncharacterized membrane protein YgdD (TMEM256/DUF423 family)
MSAPDEAPAPRDLRPALRATLAGAGLSGFVAIAFGAWSAHGAEPLLGAERAAWLRTAVQYQAWHTLALLAAGVLMGTRPGRFLVAAALAFALGIVLFSGSLYLLALTGWRPIAFATPVGGIAFLAGWLLLAIYALSLDRHA